MVSSSVSISLEAPFCHLIKNVGEEQSSHCRSLRANNSGHSYKLSKLQHLSFYFSPGSRMRVPFTPRQSSEQRYIIRKTTDIAVFFKTKYILKNTNCLYYSFISFLTLSLSLIWLRCYQWPPCFGILLLLWYGRWFEWLKLGFLLSRLCCVISIQSDQLYSLV